jgi:hypothetical protein
VCSNFTDEASKVPTLVTSTTDYQEQQWTLERSNVGDVGDETSKALPNYQEVQHW